MQYAAAGDWLEPCWWQHGFAVNELIALRKAWLGLKTSDERTQPWTGTKRPRSAGCASTKPSPMGRAAHPSSTIPSGHAQKITAGLKSGNYWRLT